LGIQECTDAVSLVFPATDTLEQGQVLEAVVETNNNTCTGQVVGHGDILTRYCNSGKFDSDGSEESGSPAQCIFEVEEEEGLQIAQSTGQQFATIAQTSAVFIPIEVEVKPETINVKCGAKKDQGDVKFTIFSNETLDVTRIAQSSLQVEVGGEFGDPDVVIPTNGCHLSSSKKLTCKVSSCPLLGPALAEHRDANGRVDIRVTGLLLQSGTEIAGEDNVGTSP